MDALCDQHQISVLVAAALLSRELVVTMNIPDFKRLFGNGAAPMLSAIQRQSVVVQFHTCKLYRVPHKIVQNAYIYGFQSFVDTSASLFRVLVRFTPLVERCFGLDISNRDNCLSVHIANLLASSIPLRNIGGQRVSLLLQAFSQSVLYGSSDAEGDFTNVFADVGSITIVVVDT